MKKGLMSLLFLIAGLFALSARADVLVLIHGYLGGAYSWDESGVTAVLQQHEWQPAGIYVAGPGGVQLLPANARFTQSTCHLKRRCWCRCISYTKFSRPSAGYTRMSP